MQVRIYFSTLYTGTIIDSFSIFLLFANMLVSSLMSLIFLKI